MPRARTIGLLVMVVAGCDSTSRSDLDASPSPRDAGTTVLDASADATSPIDAASSVDAASPRDASAPLDAALGPGAWETRAALPEANSECAVTELDGLVYVIGGYPASRVTVPTVQVYDASTDRWSLTTPLPTPLNHSVAAAVGGRIYVIGGQSDSGGSSFVDLVFAYDPATRAWSAREPMLSPRSAMASAVIGTRIYVAGGRPPRGSDFAVYDTERDEWTSLPPLPTQRNHLAAAAIGGRVYVAGGREECGFTSAPIGVLEIFDPTTGTWSSGAPMPTARGGVNGIAVGDCFYVFGGEHASGVHDENEVYHAPTNTWRGLAPLPTPVHGVTGSAFLGGYVYAPGGGTRQGGSSGSTLHQVFRVAGTCP